MNNVAKAQIAILAGGRSQRMGQDKSFLLLNGKPVIEYVIEALSTLGLPITLIANEPDKYAQFGLPTYSDIIPNKGSLGGLYTALTHSQAPYTVCVACDMPLLNSELLAYLIEQSTDYDGVVPRINGYTEPLHAVYGKTCLPAIHSKLQADQLKISGFYDDVNIRYVDEAEIKRVEPELRSMMNINTPQDWAALQNLLRS